MKSRNTDPQQPCLPGFEEFFKDSPNTDDVPPASNLPGDYIVTIFIPF